MQPEYPSTDKQLKQIKELHCKIGIVHLYACVFYLGTLVACWMYDKLEHQEGNYIIHFEDDGTESQKGFDYRYIDRTTILFTTFINLVVTGSHFARERFHNDHIATRGYKKTDGGRTSSLHEAMRLESKWRCCEYAITAGICLYTGKISLVSHKSVKHDEFIMELVGLNLGVQFIGFVTDPYMYSTGLGRKYNIFQHGAVRWIGIVFAFIGTIMMVYKAYENGTNYTVGVNDTDCKVIMWMTIGAFYSGFGLLHILYVRAASDEARLQHVKLFAILGTFTKLYLQCWFAFGVWDHSDEFSQIMLGTAMVMYAMYLANVAGFTFGHSLVAELPYCGPALSKIMYMEKVANIFARPLPPQATKISEMQLLKLNQH